MDALQKFCTGITVLNEKITTRFTIWLIYPLIFIITFDVIARYLFLKPTVWAYDLTWILYGIFVIMGAGWVLSLDGHVRADVFYNLFPSKMQKIVMIICYLIFFFPAIGGMAYACLKLTIRAVKYQETTTSTILHLPVWPVKAFMTIAIVLLLLQGISKFIEIFLALIKEFRNGKAVE